MPLSRNFSRKLNYHKRNTSIDLVKYTDVHFFCTSVFDEKYISSTIAACIDAGLSTSISFLNISKRKYERLKDSSGSTKVIKHKSIKGNIEARMVVTPSSGLKRSIAKVEGNTPFVHMPHSVASLTAIYPEDAFDDYDYIFACGEHHIAEYSEMKKVRNLNGQVMPVGYGYLDNLQSEKLKAGAISSQNSGLRVIIAPSWNNKSFLEIIGPELIIELIVLGYQVTLRPHPLYFADKKAMKKFFRLEKKHAKFRVENPYFDAIFEMVRADIMIGDFSGASFEFNKVNQKPVISIAAEYKCQNKEWKKYKNQPVELRYRESIGCIVEPDITTILKVIKSMTNSSTVAAKERFDINTLFFKGNPRVADNAVFQIKQILEMH